MTADPFLAYRPLLLDDLRRAVDGVPAHHGAVMRQQVAAAGESDAALEPGLLCLLTADALAGKSAQALPAATALTLLTSMAAVFETIATGRDEAGLIHSWGMPRTLNAGDAFFALAQETLAAAASLDAGQRPRAVTLLDQASRGLSAALFAGSPRPGSDVIAAALALGALCADADEPTLAALARLADAGRGDGAQAAALSAGVQERVIEALSYQPEAGR